MLKAFLNDFFDFTNDDLKDVFFEGAAVNSKLINRGNLFFALNGAKVDGHHYIEEAVLKGCSAVVIDKNFVGNLPDIPVIRVQDPLQSLQEMARKYLNRFNPKVIAITGSLGKTTTKEFVATLLKEKYILAYSPGNNNSQIGLPLSIINGCNGNEEVIVLEMGMTNPGEIKKLTEIAAPYLSIITKVEAVHSINFNSIEDIAWAKAEIMSHPQTRLAIIADEISSIADLTKVGTCEKRNFSMNNPDADYYLKRFLDKFIIYALSPEGVMFDNPSIIGDHNYHNLLAAIACARELNFDWYAIEEGLKKITLPEKRLQKIEKEGVVFLNDSYNAARASVIAALTTLNQIAQKNRKIAVLGDMLELGELSNSEHKKIGQKALEYTDYLFCFGKEMYAAYEIWKNEKSDHALWFESREELSKALKPFLKKGDHVLLKGSRGMETWKVLEEM